VNIKGLADETRAAIHAWASLVAADVTRSAVVQSNLKKLAMAKTKEATLPPTTPGGRPTIFSIGTTSST
jgi:hypothetical protein